MWVKTRGLRMLLVLGLAVALVVSGVAVGGCSKSGSPAKGEKWPAKPITMIVSQGPGGGTDTMVRGIQPYLQKYLGVPIMVENKVGGAGLISANYVWDQPSDGYTVLASHNALVLSSRLYAESFKPNKPLLEAFVPVYSWLTADGNGIIVKKDSPIQTLDDLVAEAQKRRLTCALAAGIGSTDHITFLQFTRAYPGQYEMVPFDSAGEAVAAVLGGHCDFGMVGLAGEGVDLARVRMLANTLDKRAEAAPDVPTFAELGHPELTLTFTVGAYLKADTPPEIVKTFEEACDKAFHDPGFQEWAKKARKPIGDGWNSQKWSEYLRFFDGVVTQVLPTVKEAMQQAQGQK